MRETTHLTLAEDGAYRRLIDNYWTSGGPIFERNIPTILGVSRTIFERKFKNKLERFFYVLDGEWFHKRVDREIHHFDLKRKKREQAGRMGGIASSNARGIAQANGRANGQAKSNQPEPLPENKKERDNLPAFTPNPAGHAELVDFRVAVVQAFETVGRSAPDTNHVAIWLARGRKPEICLAVIRNVLAKNPKKPMALAYFDRAIDDAHADPKVSENSSNGRRYVGAI